MHSTYLTFILALLAALAFAAPPSGYGPSGNGDQCITRQEASKLVGYYAAVLDHQGTDLGTPEQTVAAIMVPGYKEYSDSANEQIGLPINATTTPSRAAFAVGSQANPAAVFTTLGIYTVECNGILWRWVQYGDGGNATAIEVKGFHYFQLTKNHRLKQTYFEFNGLAAAIDTHLYGCTGGHHW